MISESNWGFYGPMHNDHMEGNVLGNTASRTFLDVPSNRRDETSRATPLNLVQ